MTWCAVPLLQNCWKPTSESDDHWSLTIIDNRRWTICICFGGSIVAKSLISPQIPFEAYRAETKTREFESKMDDAAAIDPPVQIAACSYCVSGICKWSLKLPLLEVLYWQCCGGCKVCKKRSLSQEFWGVATPSSLNWSYRSPFSNTVLRVCYWEPFNRGPHFSHQNCTCWCIIASISQQFGCPNMSHYNYNHWSD